MTLKILFLCLTAQGTKITCKIEKIRGKYTLVVLRNKPAKTEQNAGIADIVPRGLILYTVVEILVPHRAWEYFKQILCIHPVCQDKHKYFLDCTTKRVKTDAYVRQ